MYPAWPIWSRYLTPFTQSTSPLPYLPGYWGLSLLVALNKDGLGQCSGHLQAAQPRTFGPRKVYINLYFPSSNTVFWNAYLNDYQMIICTVLIVVIFLGLIDHIMEQTIPLRAFITLSWVGLKQFELKL
jgi:hypothetical protein